MSSSVVVAWTTNTLQLRNAVGVRSLVMQPRVPHSAKSRDFNLKYLRDHLPLGQEQIQQYFGGLFDQVLAFRSEDDLNVHGRHRRG